MTHNMKLHKEPFDMIKAGTKTVELRLYDEKRRAIFSGDEIVFTNTKTGQTLKREVIAVRVFPDFHELYKNFDKVSMGYLPHETADPADMEAYYSREEILKYGVVAIEIKA